MTNPISISVPPSRRMYRGRSTKPLRLAKKKKLVMVARTNALCARMATSDYRMSTAEARLHRALEGRGDERILTLDPAFSGLPDTAHGGSVLAVFDAVVDRKSVV